MQLTYRYNTSRQHSYKLPYEVSAATCQNCTLCRHSLKVLFIVFVADARPVNMSATETHEFSVYLMLPPGKAHKLLSLPTADDLR